ncbi:TPA: lmo0937 family membrane protein [Candidatus Collierbacteria bacterium]|uniref:Lmo0937 family membrane protein n=1 Tax=Candidatus Collierbacteria bacterium GW2011_GWA2_42_17 TaxID=1618378 RepID=A0A0G0Z2G6_9BACT|nr:MAG: hypothetical protein UU94_C0002G0104 [Candidatus Collierbacteria bacterium GW2011_GWB2_42_12]KKS42962.1 MAG: hypothetical protein UV06_C0004G0097 [Candidatus Collierbacteria bacterium GW2011_GWA2_42_17]KKS62107.1 MAG: hypothetical protein UV29_C0023G0010 [Candidatus Collierbacteria bacterium GW2011_GWD2_42_50]KKS62758.1 MAG: hypothetical protein UV28_C0005G0027 [Candidatus Collierbacteria bacterium GW2011_GWE2_42_48]KKS64413.1 MAG: hypothetical protein UV32_C0015G0031 [Candidatus Collie
MDIIWFIVILLIVGWFLGFSVFAVGGSLIHSLLVIALIVIVYRLITGQRI